MRNRTGFQFLSLLYLIFGPVVGGVLGLFGGYFLYCFLRGGGSSGYYGEIAVSFEYLVVGTSTGFILGLALASWYVVRGRRQPENSRDHLQSQLRKLSGEERDSICRLFCLGRNEEAIQITQRVLGVRHQEATAIAKMLQQPIGQ